MKKKLFMLLVIICTFLGTYSFIYAAEDISGPASTHQDTDHWGDGPVEPTDPSEKRGIVTFTYSIPEELDGMTMKIYIECLDNHDWNTVVEDTKFKQKNLKYSLIAAKYQIKFITFNDV